MRAEKSGTKLADTDVSYTSKSWQRHGVASEVFVNPSVNSGQGTRQLISIANQGLSEFTIQHRDLEVELGIAEHDHQYTYYAGIFTLSQQRKEGGDNFDEKRAKSDLAKKVTPFEEQKIRYDAACTLAEDLIGKFEQLSRIATNLFATQEKLGEAITKTAAGTMKLTVSIKCIDTVWKEIITLYTKIQKLKEEIIIAKMVLPAVEGRLKLVMLLGGEDVDGNVLEPQRLWIYEPVKDDPRGTTTPELLERIEEVDEDDVADYGVNTLSSSENTLVEEFEDKYKINLTAQGTSKSSNKIPSAAEAMEKLEGFRRAPKRKTVDDTPARQADTAGDAQVEGQDINEEFDEKFEDKCRVDTITRDTNDTKSAAVPESLIEIRDKTGGNRKVRDDSPELEAISDFEIDDTESDDELEFICEESDRV